MRSFFSPGNVLCVGLLAWAASACPLPAITVRELQKQLADSPQVTVIDIRTPLLFARGHIVGAINVPASVCAQKHLPPLGKVVVYDSGLGKETTEAAVAALSAKPGLTVEVLDGGYAAWESVNAQTTKPKGLRREQHNHISYAQLKALQAADVVLVDLRSPSSGPRAEAVKPGAAAVQPITDLATEFPSWPISHSPFEPAANAAKTRSAPETPPLIVLIDNGDNAAEAMARTLEANGMKRYVILTGGELILARQGMAGKQRSSPPSRLADKTFPSVPQTPR